jgi:hypothetical protein
MKYSRMLFLASSLTVIAALPAPLRAQRSIELFGGAGVTGGSIESWAKVAPYDWNQTLYDGHAQVFLMKAAGVRLGFEVGNTYLMWYTVNSCLGCSSPSYSQRDVSAWRAMAVARFNAPRLVFGEIAAGVHFFDGYNDLGAVAGIGVRVPLTANLELPIKLRGGVILDSDQNLYPVSLNAGLSLRLP